jgi:Secretion system C-terminal sorting domain
MKKALSTLFIFAIGFLIFTGQKIDDRKWNTDPRVMSVMPSGEYTGMLPLVTPVTNKIFTAPVGYNTPNGFILVNPNFRVHPSGTTQSEVPITRHPTNQQILFASSNAALMSGSSLSFISEGMYVSTNGGLNWFGSDTTAAAPITNHGGDPAPAIGPNGYFYQSYLGYTTSGIFTSYSTNNGSTWAASNTVVTGSQDKNHTFVNDVVASPYYGRVYVTWSLFTAASPNCVVSYSTNNGATYSGVINVNTPPAGHYAQGVNGAILPNGDAVICWQSPLSASPYTGDFIGFGKSTDGGVTWVTNNNIYDCNGIRGTLFAAGIRVNDFPWMAIDRSGGSRNGWIYIVTAEKSLAPAGSDADIVMHKSTDGGTTWSAGVRVNQDALNNGKSQYMPACRVDESGGFNVIYYDNRNVGGDSVQVYVSRSVDGGVTFSDVLVSDHSFKPGSIPGLAGGYQGDYIGITSGNSKIYAYWSDNSSGLYQAWMSTIDLGPSISHTNLGNTEQTTGTRNVDCVITPAGSPITPSSVKLYYSLNNPTLTSNITMTNSSGNNWTAALPLSGAGLYRYYITATDGLSRTATYPAGAPANTVSFTAAADTVKPVIAHIPIGPTPKSAWPVTVTASVTDNIGVDSAWVKWYKNTTATGIKEFKLINTSGSTFSAIFNSLNSDVVVGDVIHYRVFAQDNSSNHNRDSTALINVNITTLRLCENFSGGVVPPTNWTVSGTYWTYNAVSGYANGTGSAKFDYWTASNGTTEMLTTMTFDPSFAGDSLKFDLAQALYNTSIDSLIVETSINGGTSYITLAPMYAGATFTAPLCMSTIATTSNYTPTSAADWKSRAFVLPVGTNKVRFRAVSAFGNNLYIDNTCLSNPITGVTPISLETPNVYSLSQNYPNPFNPVTKINFALPKQGMVTLRIYDVLGREVKTLVNEVKSAGHFSVDFNASEFASGVYFYKMEANGFSDIKRMMLIK